MGATTLSGAESTRPRPRAVPIRTRNHHWKWWHPFWLSTRAPVARASPSAVTSAEREHGPTRLRQPFMGATTLSGAEPMWPSPRAPPIRGRNHHWKWCGVDVAKTARRADTRAKPPLEVVRSRRGRDRAPCRYAHETTTGSGGTGCLSGRRCGGSLWRAWRKHLLALRARHRAKTQATCGCTAGRLIISLHQRRQPQQPPLRSRHFSWLPRADAPCRNRRASCPARGACTPASTTATGVRAAPAPRADLRRCSRGASRSCGGSCGG